MKRSCSGGRALFGECSDDSVCRMRNVSPADKKGFYFLAAFLVAVSHCWGGSFVIDWTYDYGVAAQGTKSESVYGRLFYKGEELPKEYEHVITPIGEFVFIDGRGFGSNEKIRWVPFGKLAGYSGGMLNAAGTESDVQLLLTSNDPILRRVVISGTAAMGSTEACLAGSFEKPPKGVGKDWFFVVTQGLWVNPRRIDEVVKAKLAAK